MSRFYNLDQAPFNGRELSKAIIAAIAGQYNGAFFDAQDMSTMFQDAAGTTPVTAMEQPVGKWLDKSGNGNHATQSVTASRPVVSARYNVLLGTDSPVTQSVTASGVPAILSFYGTGSVALSGAYAGVLNGTGANNRVSLNFTPSAASLTLTISGSVTKIMLHRGSSLLPYQRVNTATDYDTVGFKKYLKFDGVDDYLNLPYMGLYANGSASVVMARTDLISRNGCVYIGESNSNNDAPVYWLGAKLSNNTGYGAFIRNDSGIGLCDSRSNSTGYNSNNTVVVSSMIDTSMLINKYTNGASSSQTVVSRSGVITLNNTVLGALVRTTNSGYINANIYGVVITKSALSDSERRGIERLLAYNSGAQI